MSPPRPGIEQRAATLPRRIAGDLALDFANTISWRDTGRETDHLATGEALRDWARAAGVDAGWTAPGPGELGEARSLRDAIGALGSAFAHREPPPKAALEALRDRAALALSRAALAGDPLAPVFAAPDRLLGSVAWSALALFGGQETARIKECPFHDCRWLFVDRTKNGTRRWCEMATCGNRAKKRRLASRQDPG